MQWLLAIAAVCALGLLAGAMLYWSFRSSANGAADNTAPGFRPRVRGRFWGCVSAAITLHIAIFVPSLISQIGGCQHETPRGVVGGTGTDYPKGTPEGELNGKGAADRKGTVQARTVSAAAVRRPERGRDEFIVRTSRDGLLALLRKRPDVELNPDARLASLLDDVGTIGGGEAGPLGLVDGSGTGNPAAGSPYGKGRRNTKLYLYRVKYSGGDWAANYKALPALLREVQKATNVPAGDQETITLGDLKHHRANYMPIMLYITGTGGIEATDAERANLRDYLMGGGFLMADSSGGTFEREFEKFIGQVLPGRRLRPIEFDQEVFRCRYKMPRGCPVYREHGSSEAKGIFADDGRLMVFFSPGDLGSAWAVVGMGQQRGAVEFAYQMGTNLVVYALNHVYDRRQ